MPKLVDPDQLNQGTEVVINTTAKTVQLLIAGNLDDNSPGATSGVSLQAVYSFLKEEWINDNALNKFKFPLKAFGDDQFQWINGWAPADAQTRDLFRDAGWSETVGPEAGDLWAGMISLGNHDATTDQSYYQQVLGFDQSTLDFDKTGNINEPVLIYDASGPTDYTDYFKAFLRIQGKTHASYDLLAEQDLSVLQPRLYRFPLSNVVDTNISESDANIDANAPYTGMSVDYLTGDHSNVTTWAATTVYAVGDIVKIVGVDPDRFLRCTVGGTSGASEPTGAGTDGTVTWEVDPGERQIGAEYYHFDRIVDGNSGTRFQIYEWGQRQLRKTTDINANTNGDAFGIVNGNVADELFAFVASDLVLEPGVFIDNLPLSEQNNVKFKPYGVDGSAIVEVSYPFVSVITFNFSSNIVSATDLDTRATVYFTNDDAGDNAGNDFDTAGAIIVDDNSTVDMDFQVSAASMQKDYDYDGNIQRGAASAATDAPCTLQMVGLADYENLTVEFSIPRANVTVNVNASDERNYANPA